MAGKDYTAPCFTTDPEERIISEALDEALRTPSEVRRIALQLKDDLRTLRWELGEQTPSERDEQMASELLEQNPSELDALRARRLTRH